MIGYSYRDSSVKWFSQQPLDSLGGPLLIWGGRMPGRAHSFLEPSASSVGTLCGNGPASWAIKRFVRAGFCLYAANACCRLAE